MYGPSLISTKKDFKNDGRATIVYSNKNDALYAMDHLAPISKDSSKVTIIDGRPI